MSREWSRYTRPSPSAASPHPRPGRRRHPVEEHASAARKLGDQPVDVGLLALEREQQAR